MTGFAIEELAVPTAPDAPDAADFIATVEVHNIVEADGYGTEELGHTTAEVLPRWLDREHAPRRLFVARVHDRIVARAVYETLASDSMTAWLELQVLPGFRRRGIGTALAELLETTAATESRRKLIAYTVSKNGPGARLTAPTGFGSVPRGNAEVRFLLDRGYALEQVERGSRLALPVDERELRERYDRVAATAGEDYAVHSWVDRAPRRWHEDLAMLRTRMSTDAPTAGLDEPEDVWTAQRLLDQEEREAKSPRTSLVTVVEHLPSGRLAGFTELIAPAELDRPVEQDDTLVLDGHRGHRLGTLLKVANLLNLQREKPGHPAIITFNAEENRHMLDVNEAVGFVPIGHEGAWKKLL